LPRQGDRRRGDRRAAVGGLGPGREPATRAEGAAHPPAATGPLRGRVVISAPPSKAERQARIIELLGQHQVRSQTELAELLAADGVTVTQGTLSKDLVEIGALRIRGEGGHLIYAV